MIEQKGFNYKFDENRCSTCEGNCCIGESGYVWITKDEIKRLSDYLNISTDECYEKYLIKYRFKYSLKEIQLSEDNFVCVFFDLDKKQCSIYDVRPTQCRTFPFWEYFKKNEQEVINECPAIIK